ncbi:MAG: hypothetical protein ACTHNW_11315 [Mucilaginibacter sp.]
MKKRTTPEEIKAFILKAPEKGWNNTVSNEQPVLTYHVHHAVTKGQESKVKDLLAKTPLISFGTTTQSRLFVAHAGTNNRIEVMGQSIYGTDIATITEKGGGFLFLDKGSKTYAHIAKEQKVKHYFKERFKATTTVNAEKREAVIETESPYRLKYVLQLENDEKLRGFNKDIISFIIGCPTLFAEAGVNLDPIIEAGTPVRGEVFMQLNTGAWESMSSFSVSELSVASGRKELFDIPKGYKDLREIHRQQKTGQVATVNLPVVAIGDMRNTANTPGSAQPDNGSPIGVTVEDFTFNNEVGRIPACFPETYGAKISDLVDEKLLDDVKFLVNTVTKRLSSFAGNNGTIKFDWLNQIETENNTLEAGPNGTSTPGTGLFPLLHNDNNSGLLDMLATKSVGSLMASGNNLSDIGLSASLQTTVNNILANGSIAPQNRFSSLSDTDQAAVVKDYVFNKIGTISVNYPTSSGTQSFVDGLLNVKVDNIAFNVQINDTPIINTLNFDSNGIHLTIDLPDASGSAFLNIWVSSGYWEAVAGAAIACFFGVGCDFLALLVAVGLLVDSTSGPATIDLKNLSVDAEIGLVPNAAQVLQPKLTMLHLNATVHTTWTPSVSLGLNNLIDDIVSVAANHTSIILNAAQSAIQSKLNDYIDKDLNITYPPKFGPVNLTGIGSTVDFQANNFGYVEQNLNAGLLGIIDPYVTQIDPVLEPNVLTLRDKFKLDFQDPEDAMNAVSGSLLGWAGVDFTSVARYYLGTVLSQNFINYYVYSLWRNGDFNFNFSPAQTHDIYNAVRAAFPHLGFPQFNDKIMSHLWQSVPPRTLFTPWPASEGKYYATTFFDDVRLCFEATEKLVIEFSFSAQAFTEIGFGGLNTSTGQLDLLKISDRVFDIYFDLTNLGVKVINAEVQHFVEPGMQPSINFDYSPLNHLQTLFAQVLKWALVKRDNSCIPHGTGDPVYLQRYAIGTNNSWGAKNAGNPLAAVFQLLPYKGNLYVSQGLSGLVTGILQGTNDLDIDTMTAVTASIITAFV